MKVLSLEYINKELWNSLIENSNDAWLFHKHEWIELTSEVYQLKNIFLLAEENGKFYGGFPLQFSNNLPSAYSIMMGATGPFAINDVPSVKKSEIFILLTNYAKNILKENNIQSILCSCPPLARNNLNNLRGINPLVLGGWIDRSTHTKIIDLKKTEAELWQDLSRNVHREIKRATTNGYVVEQVLWNNDTLKEYYRIHCENYERTGITPHPFEYFKTITDLSDKIGSSVLNVCKNQNGKSVGFLNSARYNSAALYWTVCTENDHQENGINYLLVWEDIKNAKKSGCYSYDLSEVFPNAEGGKIKYLTEFKSKFGGNYYRYFKGEIHIKNESLEKNDINGYIKNWLYASKNLTSSIIGDKTAETIAILLKWIVALIKKLFRATKFIAKWIKNFLHPPIPFIKHYWDKQEFSVLKKPPQKGLAIENLKDKFRKKLNLGTDETIVFTGSGRTALELALKVLKMKYPEKNKVIIPTYGCKGTIDPIIKNGLTPVFADIDYDFKLDIKSIKKCLSNDILACLAVHPGGITMDFSEIYREAKEWNFFIIEDHCQNLGGKTGNQGDISIYSFGIGKNLMSSAGGAVVSTIFKNEFIAESNNLQAEPPVFAEERIGFILKRYFNQNLKFQSTKKNYPEEPNQYQFNYVAINTMDTVILDFQLDKLDEIIKRRRQNAKSIINKLSQFPDVFCLSKSGNAIYTKLSVRLKNKSLHSKFNDFMSELNIELECMYTPLHLRNFGSEFYRERLPVSEEIYPLVINIPVRPNLKKNELLRITAAIEKFGKTFTN